MFDDLKKIAGVHTGATPHTLLKIPAKTIAPIVTSHPLAPVQRSTMTMNPLAPVQRAPAPAPAPMPKIAATPTPSTPPPHNAAPSFHLNVPKIKETFGNAAKPSSDADHTFTQRPSPTTAVPLAPPTHADLQSTSPALASLAVAAGIVASSSSSPSLPSMTSTASSATAPTGAGGGGSFLVDRGPPSASHARSQSIAGAGSEARGYERVERSARPKNAQGMPPSGSTDSRGGTLKGASIMGYKGTGEKTYLPINSAGNVPANSQVSLPSVRPSKPFQGQKLLIDPSLWAVFQIIDIKLGNDPVAVSSGPVSAGCFPPANGPSFEWKVADGVDVNVIVANVTATATPFSALILGEICVQSA